MGTEQDDRADQRRSCRDCGALLGDWHRPHCTRDPLDPESYWDEPDEPDDDQDAAEDAWQREQADYERFHLGWR